MPKTKLKPKSEEPEYLEPDEMDEMKKVAETAKANEDLEKLADEQRLKDWQRFRQAFPSYFKACPMICLYIKCPFLDLCQEPRAIIEADKSGEQQGTHKGFA